MWPYFWSDQNSLYIVDWFLKLTQLILSDVTGVSLLRCNPTLVALLSVVTHTDLCKSKRTRGRILNGVIGIFVLLLEIMKRFFFFSLFYFVFFLCLSNIILNWNNWGGREWGGDAYICGLWTQRHKETGQSSKHEFKVCFQHDKSYAESLKLFR